MTLCPSCFKGNCYKHKEEYINTKGLVTKCRCNDPEHKHGKLQRKEEKK